eukprot:365707-Chlamydomonas_euryale.AAC.40
MKQAAIVRYDWISSSKWGATCRETFLRGPVTARGAQGGEPRPGRRCVQQRTRSRRVTLTP